MSGDPLGRPGTAHSPGGPTARRHENYTKIDPTQLGQYFAYHYIIKMHNIEPFHKKIKSNFV